MRTNMFGRVYKENKITILDFLEKNPSASLLDVGCANGVFTEEIANKIKAKHVYGVEILDEQIAKAAKKGIEVKKFDLNKKFLFRDNSFDVVVANQVLEHVYATDNFAKEIYRVLKPGGYAIISTPNLASFHNICSLALGLQPFQTSVSDEIIVGNFLNPYKGVQIRGGEHLRLFTLPAMKEFLEYHKFKVEKVNGVGFYPFPKIISRVLCGNLKRYSVYLTAKVRK